VHEQQRAGSASSASSSHSTVSASSGWSAHRGAGAPDGRAAPRAIATRFRTPPRAPTPVAPSPSPPAGRAACAPGARCPSLRGTSMRSAELASWPSPRLPSRPSERAGAPGWCCSSAPGAGPGPRELPRRCTLANAGSWAGRRPVRPGASELACVGPRSSPARMRSKVDFPEPLTPTRPTARPPPRPRRQVVKGCGSRRRARRRRRGGESPGGLSQQWTSASGGRPDLEGGQPCGTAVARGSAPAPAMCRSRPPCRPRPVRAFEEYQLAADGGAVLRLHRGVGSRPDCSSVGLGVVP
jgi:hypothetical protein